MHDILIIEDEEDIRSLMAGILQDEGYLVKVAHNAESGLKLFSERQPSLVLLDVWLGKNERDGISILEEIKKQSPQLPVIMISGHSTIEKAVIAIKGGAFDFLEKPFQMDRLIATIENALKMTRLESLSRAKLDFKDIVCEGKSEFSKKLKERIFENIDNKINLIVGPKGSRKIYIVEMLHQYSKNKDFPLIVTNKSCGDYDKFLFGYEIESSNTRKIGALEEAHMGTIYINDIKDLSKSVQKKLLDYCITGHFTRLGSDKVIESQTKVIFGSTLHYYDLVEYLRPDFLSRIWVDPIINAPLKERIEDIKSMIQFVCEKINVKLEITTEVLNALMYYQWPFNIHELELLIQTFILKEKQTVAFEDLPKDIAGESMSIKWLDLDFKEAKEMFEKEYINHYIRKHRGNVSVIANEIGLDRTALYRKMKTLELN